MPTTGTFFETAKFNFKNVSIDNKAINTSEFLEASESVVSLFDHLSVAFKAVQVDMSGNIKKIRDRQLAFPDKSETLQALTSAEIAEGKKTATQGLLWLNRGLSFTSVALRGSHTNPTEELGKSFDTAYQETLKKHHGMVAKALFSTAMMACPTRATFYPKLGNDQEVVMRQLDEWLCGLERVTKILNDDFDKITKDVKL